MRDLEQAVAEADLVVGHAGVGTALAALLHGKCPLLLPRDTEHGEHADDHQRYIAEDLTRRGLAVTADADLVSASDLRQAASIRSERSGQPPRFVLQPD